MSGKIAGECIFSLTQWSQLFNLLPQIDEFLTINFLFVQFAQQALIGGIHRLLALVPTSA